MAARSRVLPRARPAAGAAALAGRAGPCEHLPPRRAPRPVHRLPRGAPPRPRSAARHPPRKPSLPLRTMGEARDRRCRCRRPLQRVAHARPRPDRGRHPLRRRHRRRARGPGAGLGGPLGAGLLPARAARARGGGGQARGVPAGVDPEGGRAEGAGPRDLGAARRADRFAGPRGSDPRDPRRRRPPVGLEPDRPERPGPRGRAGGPGRRRFRRAANAGPAAAGARGPGRAC